MPTLISELATGTNPVTFLGALSARGWFGLGLLTLVTYCHWISKLSRRPKDLPCPEFGCVLRVLYGLFSTRLAEFVLSYFLHTKRGEPQAEQHGGTIAIAVGWPELRVEIIPVLGSVLGGNYAYLVWDEADPERQAVVVDPSDPYPVYNAARERGLNVVALLCSHWHFDHSGGNRTLKRLLPSLEVVAGQTDASRTPCVTRPVADLEEWNVGRLTIRAHHMPGHTLGSTIFEVETRADAIVPTIAFTGDTLFCGGCGALFEASASVMYASFQKLRQRLRADCQIFPGHEYTEMLLSMAVKREPMNTAARRCLRQAQDKRAQKLPTVPSTMAYELEYNPHLRADVRALAALCGCNN
jgi:hydroxyacylglutathione hydrolase